MNLIENFVRDVRLGLRMLRRNPGFTVLGTLCLTLASAPTPPCSAGLKAFLSGLIRSFLTRSAWWHCPEPCVESDGNVVARSPRRAKKLHAL